MDDWDGAYGIVASRTEIQNSKSKIHNHLPEVSNS